MVAHAAGVPLNVIRRWLRRGFITPVRVERRLAYFDFCMVTRARRLAGWLQHTAHPVAAERALASWLSDHQVAADVLDDAEVRFEGNRVLVRLGQAWLDRLGQQWLDFESCSRADVVPPQEPSVESLRLPLVSGTDGRESQPPSVDELLEWADEFEERQDWARAADAYRAALAAGGPRADLCFQLAEALYRQGDVTAARERYFMALEIDEDFIEARANLGCVLAELGDVDLALEAFRGVLRLVPDYPDVHYHTARLLDELNQAVEAEVHWRAFLELAPDSPWADVARRRLSGVGDRQ